MDYLHSLSRLMPESLMRINASPIVLFQRPDHQINANVPTNCTTPNGIETCDFPFESSHFLSFALPLGGRPGRDWDSYYMWLTIPGTSHRRTGHELYDICTETPQAPFEQLVLTDKLISYPSIGVQ